MSKYSSQYTQTVFSYLKNVGYNGEFLDVETQNNSKLEQALDVCAGIDYFYKSNNRLYGCALRVQPTTAYNTFTIRQKTEYVKRQSHVGSKALYPEFTIQAYIDSIRNVVRSVGVCRTRILYDFIKKTNQFYVHVNTQDGKRFLCVKWEDMLDKGYPVATFGAEV